MPEPDAIAKSLSEPLLKIFPPALLGRLVTIPCSPLSDEMQDQIVELQINTSRSGSKPAPGSRSSTPTT
jgi:type VI secretion system protein VasG